MAGENSSRPTAEVCVHCVMTKLRGSRHTLSMCVGFFPEIIARKGLNNVTVDSLVQDVTPKARGLLWTAMFSS